MTSPHPFAIHVPDDRLADLHARLERVRWPDEAPDGGWQYGSDSTYMKALVAYWREQDRLARARDASHRFSKDVLLTNVMLYWVTGAINSSFWLYWARRHEPWPFGEHAPVHAPTAYAAAAQTIPCGEQMANPPVDAIPGAITHDNQTEGYSIVSGGGTAFIDGHVVNGRHGTANPDGGPNGPGCGGLAVGSRKVELKVGDVLIVPPGVIHGWVDIPDHVDYLSFRPSHGVMKNGWVNLCMANCESLSISWISQLARMGVPSEKGVLMGPIPTLREVLEHAQQSTASTSRRISIAILRRLTHLVVLAGVPVSNLLQQQVPAVGLILGRVGSAHRPFVFSGGTCRSR